MTLNRRMFAHASMLAAAGLAQAQAVAQPTGPVGAAQPAPPVRPKGPDAIVELADYCLKTSYAQLPAAVVAATKNQILDTLGISLAGVKESGVRELRDISLEMGGKPEARVWGGTQRVPAHEAARINATMAHALDYDDTYEKSFMHPAVVTIPTALAVADMLGNVSGEELITAVALGVDISCRLANSAQPGVNAFKVGWHNTTVYGYFASAFVAGKLMGLTREQLISAAGIAFHQAAGNAQAHVDGALTKRMGPGFASYAGLFSARLAQRGVHGAKGVLEGVRGFYYQYHASNYSRALLLDGLGTRFAGTDVSFKPWPSCRGSHTAADAALALFAEAGISAADVEHIMIANAPGDFQLLNMPLEKKQRPTTTVDAQFSNPWVVAAALVDRKVGLNHFTPQALQRADLQAVTQRIRATEDERLARPGGGPGAARIEVQLHDGRMLSRTVAHAKGEPNHPMTPAEFAQKFFDCTEAAGMGRAQAQVLLQQVERLEKLPQAHALTAAAAITP